MSYVFSKNELEDGQKLLDQKKITSLLFSEGTYQLEITAATKPKKSVWPFIQLNDSGEILDAFCTCPIAEKKGSCEHLAASYLKIRGEDPYHVRFRESLWNQIALISAQRHGYQPRALKQSNANFETFSQTGKRLICLIPKKGKKKLEEILFNRPVETEETSLKFSNLDPEELTLWREGRPSAHLQYELSFWSDLAKWLFLLQEDHVSYKIRFSEEDLPQFLTVDLPEIGLEFYIDEAHWPQIIPTLNRIDSPLKVHFYSLGKLEAIIFLPEQGELVLDFEEMPSSSPLPLEQGRKIGDWLFFPKKGFFPRRIDPLLEQKSIKKEQLSLFFQKHLKLLQKHLHTEKIHPHPIPAKYDLYFDENYSLHIDLYIFEKKDLHQKKSHYFGEWVYLPEKGFFQIEKQLFEGLSLITPKEKVSDFVNRHRVWLHSFEGYQTHVSGVESRLGYTLNEKGQLVFFVKHEFTEETENIIDLGDWIYVREKGFYAKVTSRLGGFVKAGMKIEPSKISSFIHEHRGELEPINGFFARNCPLEKSGLNIDFNEEGKIQIIPEFFFLKKTIPEKVKIFGDYTYVAKEGFSLIPHTSRLPENYQVEKVIDSFAEPYFVGYELELLYPHVLTINPQLKRPTKMSLRLLGIKRDPNAKTGQWILDLVYETNIGRVCVFTIWQAIWQGKQYLFSDAGLIFLRKKRFDWLRMKSKKKWLRKGVSLRLTTLEFLRLTAFEELLEPEGETKKAREAKKLLADFLHLKAPTDPDLTGLISDLRPYQKTGVSWLWFLYFFGLSGLLCDEMGLGKTHQAMGLITAIKNGQNIRKAKFLVVCPTSVIYHWEKLIQTFLPSIRTYIFHGIGRKFKAFSEDSYDLLLTSYGIVRSETKALSSFNFDLAIFDELQVAKNEKSLTNQSLRKISAKMRLGLTGTPIENRLLELKALFDLVIPTYLPNTSVFKEMFVNPIEKYQDEKKQNLLKRFIHPFLLRRKKSEVLTELPEKIEEIALCDLSEEQSLLYQKFVKENRTEILKKLEDLTKPPPIAHIFSLLTKLKQICNHPCLINKDIQHYKKYQSGKWDLFLELVEETRDSKQKFVVFSQYLGMLDIIGMYFKEKGIQFGEIRGSTQDRKQQVERFAKDPNCEAFLGSLQAAGVGIDLISASVVIHYDRWWNPAKENQATDRVHRIGQKRGVQVFKLVTKNTIEEHIDTLIEKKQSLAKGIIGFDNQDHIKRLDRKDLIELLTLLK